MKNRLYYNQLRLEALNEKTHELRQAITEESNGLTKRLNTQENRTVHINDKIKYIKNNISESHKFSRNLHRMIFGVSIIFLVLSIINIKSSFENYQTSSNVELRQR